jgi:glutathione synthase
MKFLFIADRFETLKPKGDSTLELVRSALIKKHKVFWCTDTDLQMNGFYPRARAVEILECEPDALPKLAEGENVALEFGKVDAVIIRKDPPFDEHYVKLCWLLSLAERKTFMMNRPSLLLRYHEKLIPQEACARGFLTEADLIPTFMNDLASAKLFFTENPPEKVVIKPFLGFGGGNVTSQSTEDFLKSNNENINVDTLIQPFQPEISEGDFRVFLLDGQILASFARVPAAGGFISNLAQGGAAVAKPLTTIQIEKLTQLGAFLKTVGIVLAGADVIGDKISEVNITSPTGLVSLLKLEGQRYADNIISYAERNVILFPFT